MNTDKIDLDEIEAKMGLIEKMMHELDIKLLEQQAEACAATCKPKEQP